MGTEIREKEETAGRGPQGGSSAVPLRDRAALSTVEAAAFLGVGYSTMKKWRAQGVGPRYAKVGSLVLYRPADLEAFVEDALVGSGSTGPAGRGRPRRTGRRTGRG